MSRSAAVQLLICAGNVSVCLWPIDMLPSIYNYGHAAPFWHISTAVRTIVFNTTDHGTPLCCLMGETDATQSDRILACSQCGSWFLRARFRCFSGTSAEKSWRRTETHKKHKCNIIIDRGTTMTNVAYLIPNLTFPLFIFRPPQCPCPAVHPADTGSHGPMPQRVVRPKGNYSASRRRRSSCPRQPDG